ncbi:transmembrane protein 51a isoform X2 [Sander lucioperca]|uniref:Transmembrane protein 51-like n=2 Tax=Sander lucioperca TaxID=283035 RepID=A0A8C9YBE2_SANLU|nr:transmembrane protein 51a isoform X2 [Sander lucioperca]XP_035863738.1 transmembrane protein 51a isoform X2 [Sander lucioperca]
MRSSSSVDGPPSAIGRGGTGSNNNNNNNHNSSSSSSENSGNSGSQYALCALGVGLVALGIVMIVWSVVPADGAGNSSSSSGGDGDTSGRKHKASSVAFVLAGSGVVMLLLSLCLGMRNKQREQQRLQQAQDHRVVAAREQEERETAEEQAHRYAVPSYEEVVGSGQYPVRQSNPRPSTSQLPSYDDLIQVDGVQYEFEGSEATTTGSQTAPASIASAAAASTSNRRAGKNSRKLLPIKIRRIKSEKLHMKNIDNAQPPPGFSIEPLTPPPQYEDKGPPL